VEEVVVLEVLEPPPQADTIANTKTNIVMIPIMRFIFCSLFPAISSIIPNYTNTNRQLGETLEKAQPPEFVCMPLALSLSSNSKFEDKEPPVQVVLVRLWSF
jgi:hypothetical protein